MRTVADIEGMVTAVETGPAVPPPVLQTFYAGEGASQVLTIRDNDGIDWKLGYDVGRGSPTMNVTPDLMAMIGTRARLLFRAVRGFGTAPGFVLFDAVGVMFAMDLAIYGDPLQTDDVAGLTVQDGTVLATTKDNCVDHLLHTSLVFTADKPVDVRPNTEGTVFIQGTRYAATNLFSVRADGQARCPDFVGTERGWAIWRRP